MLGSRLCLTACAGLVLVAVPAWAQKIAPSRSYSNESTYSSYTSRRTEKPDKEFGTPSFATPGAQMPKQQTLGTQEQPANREGAPPPVTGEPDAPNASGLGSLTPAPSSPTAATQNEASSSPDFFSGTSDLELPKHRPASGGDESDTPLFTTGSGSDAGTATPSD